jgi:phosphoribosyl-ATP pyrophosphohydrolase
MLIELDCVASFHDKMGVSKPQPLADHPIEMLVSIGDSLKALANKLEGPACTDSDKRWLRAHLLIEELGETIYAIGQGDEQETLDGLTDLLYVLLGTAVTFDLPLDRAFVDVHLSNMSKERQDTDPHGERVRDKGPGYQPPDLEKVLEDYRGTPRRRTNLVEIFERKWLEQHPRKYDALTPDNKKKVAAFIETLLEDKS